VSGNGGRRSKWSLTLGYKWTGVARALCYPSLACGASGQLATPAPSSRDCRIAWMEAAQLRASESGVRSRVWCVFEECAVSAGTSLSHLPRDSTSSARILERPSSTTDQCHILSRV
jgi:hypothetical protein